MLRVEVDFFSAGRIQRKLQQETGHFETAHGVKGNS